MKRPSENRGANVIGVRAGSAGHREAGVPGTKSISEEADTRPFRGGPALPADRLGGRTGVGVKAPERAFNPDGSRVVIAPGDRVPWETAVELGWVEGDDE